MSLIFLHGADFFSYGLLVGSWVFPVYHEYFGISYVLRTLDLDLAVDATSKRIKDQNIEELFHKQDYIIITDYETGLRKFTKGGFEIEFLVQRNGRTDHMKAEIKELNISAIPLPFIDILFTMPLDIDLGDYGIVIPCPESMFLHKMIVSQKRPSQSKKMNC